MFRIISFCTITLFYSVTGDIDNTTISTDSVDGTGLIIYPKGRETVKSVGSGLMLTCMPIGLQVTELKWLDPKGRVIDTSAELALFAWATTTGQTLSFLMFFKLQDTMAGEYTCTGRSVETQLSLKAVKVITIADITWRNAPENQYAVLDDDYFVNCEVQANPLSTSPIVDWIRNGKRIESSDKYVVHTRGLLIRNIQESDDGIYTCVAYILSTGHLASRNIKVEVQVAPKIKPIRLDPVVEGSPAIIECNAVSKPPSTYTWIREDTGENLSKKDGFTVIENVGLLVIRRIEISDDAKYKCLAKNAAGQDEVTFSLEVLGKPKIWELMNLTVSIHSSVQMICQTSGQSLPTVSFRKVGSEAPFGIGQQPSDDRINFELKIDEDRQVAVGVLTIDLVKRSDDGLYECAAKNRAGAAYRNGHITVEFAPTFEKTANDSLVWTWGDKPATLTCASESIPNATLKWRLGGYDIRNDNSLFRIIGQGPTSSLIVKTQPGEKRLFGRYECIATNKLGQTSNYVELREATLPVSVEEVLVDTVRPTEIKFSIVDQSVGLPVRRYVVQYRMDGKGTWDLARNKTWSVDTPYVIGDLVPQGTYVFRFAAVNDVGQGSYGRSTLRFTMPRQLVPAEPKILVSPSLYDDEEVESEILANSPYANDFELRWKVPDDNGEPIDRYDIRYRVVERIGDEWLSAAKECGPEVECQSYELKGLIPNTKYEIELRAHNSLGFSSPAQIRFRTAPSAGRTFAR